LEGGTGVAQTAAAERKEGAVEDPNTKLVLGVTGLLGAASLSIYVLHAFNAWMSWRERAKPWKHPLEH
jgi:hypothetical protein